VARDLYTNYHGLFQDRRHLKVIIV
jgi:hypothetical protein